MLVRDLMTPDPLTILPSATLEEALEVMTRNEIHELPVVEADRVAGIITDRDLRGALGGDDPSSSDLAREVSEVMSETVEVVSTETSLAEACRRIASLRISSVPVVDSSLALVGILSVTDILAAAAERFEQDGD